MADVPYSIPMFARLEPRTAWKGGIMADTDVLTLEEAAQFATRHAGTDVTIGDFLRAASRGQIQLAAIVHRGAKVRKYDGGIYCNQGTPTENVIPEGAIPTLPQSARRQLANAGRASWRTIDGFETVQGVLMRYTVAELQDEEPDFETVTADCRVTGFDVHALADAFLPAPLIVSAAAAQEAEPLELHGRRLWLLREGVEAIAAGAGISCEALAQDAADAIKAGTLKPRNPGTGLPTSKSDNLTDFLDRFYSEDFNHWLQAIGAPFAFRLPEDGAPRAGDASRPNREAGKAQPDEMPMRRRVLIAKHSAEWPTLEGDLAGASTNGLAAAKGGERGWRENAVLAWLRANRMPRAAPPTLVSLPVTRHRLGK